MKYNFDKIQEASFCCISSFLQNIMCELEKTYSYLAIVATGELAMSIFRELSSYRDKYGYPIFNFGYVDIDTIDYMDEYIISVSSDGMISMEKMKTDDDIYLLTEADIIFLHEDCNFKALQRLNDGENNIVIFGIGE